MADYASLRQQHGVRLSELLPALFERLTWPRARLETEREAAVRTMLVHAATHSPWHRERLAGIAVERLTARDLGALPIMTKRDLMQHFDTIVTDPRLTRDAVEAHLDGLGQDAYLLDEYHACASGGSSGLRGVFVYDFDGWATTFASYIRFQMRTQLAVLGPEPLRRVMIAADKASHMTAAFAQTFPPPDGALQRLSAKLPLPRLVDALNTLQPDALAGYASIVCQLAHEAAAGRLRIAPRLINTTSEPLLPEMRAAIAAVWPALLVNGFGSTEGLMGGSCTAGRGIHLSDDLFVIEPVDAAGRAVADGARAAKVLLTSLVNRAQPLIRYELTDEVVVLDEPCPCGSALMRIDDIEGRLDDSFAYAGGPTVHPFTFRSVLGRARAVLEYQVRQTACGVDIALRTETPIDPAPLAAAVSDALRSAGLADPVVTVTVADTLTRQSSTGKLRRFIPLPADG